MSFWKELLPGWLWYDKWASEGKDEGDNGGDGGDGGDSGGDNGDSGGDNGDNGDSGGDNGDQGGSDSGDEGGGDQGNEGSGGGLDFGDESDGDPSNFSVDSGNFGDGFESEHGLSDRGDRSSRSSDFSFAGSTDFADEMRRQEDERRRAEEDRQRAEQEAENRRQQEERLAEIYRLHAELLGLTSQGESAPLTYADDQFLKNPKNQPAAQTPQPNAPLSPGALPLHPPGTAGSQGRPIYVDSSGRMVGVESDGRYTELGTDPGAYTVAQQRNQGVSRDIGVSAPTTTAEPTGPQSTEVATVAANAAAQATAQAGGSPQETAQAAEHAARIATDRQTLGQQSAWTRAAFRSTYGEQADAEWARQHTAELERNRTLYGAAEPRAGAAPLAGSPAGTVPAPDRRIGVTPPPGPGETGQYGINTRLPDIGQNGAAAVAAPSRGTTETGSASMLPGTHYEPIPLTPAANAGLPPERRVPPGSEAIPRYTGPPLDPERRVPPSAQAVPAAQLPLAPERRVPPGSEAVPSYTPPPTTGLDEERRVPPGSEAIPEPIQGPIREYAPNYQEPPVQGPMTGPAEGPAQQSVYTPPETPLLPGQREIAPPPPGQLPTGSQEMPPQAAGVQLDPQSGEVTNELPPEEQTFQRFTGQQFDPLGTAQDYAGARYVFGGGRDGTGFGVPGSATSDCSSFVSAVWRQEGIGLVAHTDSAYMQLQQLGAPRVALNEAQPGDVVFYMGAGSGGAITHHMGIYAGNNQVLDQSVDMGGGVKLRPVDHAGQFVIMRDPRMNPDQPVLASAPAPQIQMSGTAEADGGKPPPGLPDRPIEGTSMTTEQALASLDTSTPIETIASLAGLTQGKSADEVAANGAVISNGLAQLMSGNKAGQWAEPWLNDTARLAWAREERTNGRASDPRDTPEQYIEKWKDAFFGGDRNVALVGELRDSIQGSPDYNTATLSRSALSPRMGATTPGSPAPVTATAESRTVPESPAARMGRRLSAEMTTSEEPQASPVPQTQQARTLEATVDPRVQQASQENVWSANQPARQSLMQEFNDRPIEDRQQVFEGAMDRGLADEGITGAEAERWKQAMRQITTGQGLGVPGENPDLNPYMIAGESGGRPGSASRLNSSATGYFQLIDSNRDGSDFAFRGYRPVEYQGDPYNPVGQVRQFVRAINASTYHGNVDLAVADKRRNGHYNIIVSRREPY